MHSQLIHAICSHYRLGKCFSQPIFCAAGKVNQVWQIETSIGKYIIKILNPTVINQNGQCDRYRIREHMAYLLQRDISLVSAIKQNDDPLFQFKKDIVMVFPYIDSRLLLQQDIQPVHAGLIASAIAKIHAANIQVPHPPEVNLFVPHALHEIEETRVKKYLNIDPIFLELLCEEYRHYIPVLSHHLLMSHRDCDPKNVLWDQNGQYYIIDWESAGLINQTHDLMATAIYWSLDQNYHINLDLLKVFIDSYIQHQGVVCHSEIEAGFYGLLGDWLGWLDFNISRVIMQPIDSDEFRLGVEEARKTLVALPILYHQFDVISVMPAKNKLA